jgi:hypothetical protein
LAKTSDNYLATCQTCNSRHKSDFFPVRSPLTAEEYAESPEPDRLNGEEPFLLMPFGESEARPAEDFIAFLGTLAVPAPNLSPDSFDYWRAKVTIELLGLNREDLQFQRGRVLANLAFRRCLAPTVAEEVSVKAKFRRCQQCFLELFESQSELALGIASRCVEEHLSPYLEVLTRSWPQASPDASGN